MPKPFLAFRCRMLTPSERRGRRILMRRFTSEKRNSQAKRECPRRSGRAGGARLAFGCVAGGDSPPNPQEIAFFLVRCRGGHADRCPYRSRKKTRNELKIGHVNGEVGKRRREEKCWYDVRRGGRRDEPGAADRRGARGIRAVVLGGERQRDFRAAGILRVVRFAG